MPSHVVSLFLRHIHAWRHPGEMLNSVQASGIRSKGERKARFGEMCRILKWKGKEFCPNKVVLVIPRRNADQGSQGEYAAQTVHTASIQEDGTLSGKSVIDQTRREKSNP